MRRLLSLLILLIAVPAALLAIPASAIYFASDDDLRAMCALRGIGEGTREEMQEALYAYEGIEAYSEESEGEEDGEYTLTINAAENLSREGDRVVLTGNSSISFADDGVVSELSADTIVIEI